MKMYINETQLRHTCNTNIASRNMFSFMRDQTTRINVCFVFFGTINKKLMLTEYLFCFKYVPNLDRIISFFDLRLLLALLFVVRFDVSAISISSSMFFQTILNAFLKTIYNNRIFFIAIP